MKSFYDLSNAELEKLKKEFLKTAYGKKMEMLLNVSIIIGFMILMLTIVEGVTSIVLDFDYIEYILLSNVCIFLISVFFIVFSSVNITKCLKTYYEDTKKNK